MSESTSQPILDAVIEGALDVKGEDIIALDVRALTSYADTFVIVTATSDRRARAITDSISQSTGRVGHKPMGVEGYDEGRWVLIDLGEIIVHVFLDEIRREYDLERLWSDAPRLDVSTGSDQTAVQ